MSKRRRRTPKRVFPGKWKATALEPKASTKFMSHAIPLLRGEEGDAVYAYRARTKTLGDTYLPVTRITFSQWVAGKLPRVQVLQKLENLKVLRQDPSGFNLTPGAITAKGMYQGVDEFRYLVLHKRDEEFWYRMYFCGSRLFVLHRDGSVVRRSIIYSRRDTVLMIFKQGCSFDWEEELELPDDQGMPVRDS